MCRLKHPELLDAAHIIADKDVGGEPLVTNGLALCKLHHAAFDENLLGVSPDYTLVVRSDVLKESDGPMLLHGLQGLEGKPIEKPRDPAYWPDRDRLAERFERFRRAG
jgi:putative restriction endonuclease